MLCLYGSNTFLMHVIFYGMYFVIYTQYIYTWKRRYLFSVFLHYSETALRCDYLQALTILRYDILWRSADLCLCSMYLFLSRTCCAKEIYRSLSVAIECPLTPGPILQINRKRLLEEEKTWMTHTYMHTHMLSNQTNYGWQFSQTNPWFLFTLNVPIVLPCSGCLL